MCVYWLNSFNPYSPGFSIYLEVEMGMTGHYESFNPYSPGFSIYFIINIMNKHFRIGFNPYSPGFSIYLRDTNKQRIIRRRLQSLFTWIFYLFGKLEDINTYYQVLQSLFTWIFYLFKRNTSFGSSD